MLRWGWERWNGEKKFLNSKEVKKVYFFGRAGIKFVVGEVKDLFGRNEFFLAVETFWDKAT